MSRPEVEFAAKLVERYVAAKVLPQVQEQVRLEVETVGNSITIWECRPPWRPEYGPDWTRMGIARFRYSPSKKSWTVYWMGSDLKFHQYTLVGPQSGIGPLLDEVARDPHACFWADAGGSSCASRAGLPPELRGGLREIPRSRYSIEEARDVPARSGVQAENEGAGRPAVVGIRVPARRPRLRAAASWWLRDPERGGESATKGARPARAEWRPATITLAEFVDEYLEMHQAAPVTITKLRWLLDKATAEVGERLLADLPPRDVYAWRMRVPEGHRFEATQALRQVLNRAIAWGLLDYNPAKLGVPNPPRRAKEKRRSKRGSRSTPWPAGLGRCTGRW